MCGRYALALRPSQVRRMLQDDNMPVADAPGDEGEGEGAPRQSYNFAPGYHGIVYRADVPDWGAGPRRESKSKSKSKGGGEGGKAAGSSTGDEEGKAHTQQHGTTTTAAAANDGDEEDEEEAIQREEGGEAEATRYKLQSMKWGLIPFWTKKNPDYGSMMKTINCRDDSLAQSGGMWNSMKGRKRCVVVAQGFYEWLKSGRDKVPHFVKRRDGKLMCFAGLWDCVKYEDAEDKHYTYTIITTDSNKQLRFLHDRMPVILEPASEQMRTWLDPGRYEWSRDLQDVLVPFGGELEVYPVSKEVGKVGNNSPSFMIPIASRENKSNIANFFANAQAKKRETPGKKEVEVVRKGETTTYDPSSPVKESKTVDEVAEDADDGGMGVSPAAGSKRKGDEELEGEEPPRKKEGAAGSSPVKTKLSPSPSKPAAKGSRTISATSNGTKSPVKGKGAGTQKITKFFGNSA